MNKLIVLLALIAFVAAQGKPSTTTTNLGEQTTTKEPKGEENEDTSGKGQKVITNGEISVTIPGGGSRPSFTFKHADSDKSYKVKLQQIYEIEGELADFKKVPSSTFSLNSLSWTASDSSEADEFKFTIAAEDPKAKRFTSMKFVNHLTKDAGSNDTSVKFDVELTGYQWVGDENAKLALLWSLGTNDEGDALSQDADGTVHAGNSYFGATSSAEAGGATIDVELWVVKPGSNPDGGSSDRLVLVYDHFDGDLVHDPVFGLGDKEQNGASLLSLSSMLVVVMALFML